MIIETNFPYKVKYNRASKISVYNFFRMKNTSITPNWNSLKTLRYRHIHWQCSNMGTQLTLRWPRAACIIAYPWFSVWWDSFNRDTDNRKSFNYIHTLQYEYRIILPKYLLHTAVHTIHLTKTITDEFIICIEF